MARAIRFLLNGEPAEVDVDPRRRLLWVLRSDLELTGTKYGCGERHCGACTVLVDGEAVRSCDIPVSAVESREITTIEGLAADGELHPVQSAFAQHDALQCGFCTPGMILGAVDLLRRRPDPTEDDIVRGLERHLCRCGAHTRIIQAVQTASREMRGGTS